MKIVVFGLSISSAWGNGHATLLRGLFRALHDQGHTVAFFERDTHYYSAHRDASSFPFVDLILYNDWNEILHRAERQVGVSDAAIVTSYCPDGVAASRLVTQSNCERTVFYDMDTPVTLHRLQKGEHVAYLPPEGLSGFDLVLSYTGGDALGELRTKLHARCVAPLYGWVDPAIHHPAPPVEEFRADLSYLGTYAADRQPALEELLMKPARALPEHSFIVAGAMFPPLSDKTENVSQLDHIAPDRHPAFFSSSRLTLNITRASMAAMGFCPSGRIFEASACGTPVLSDWWNGLDAFFTPGEEILVARSITDSCHAVLQDPGLVNRVGARARQRTLDCHTADIRARQLIQAIENPVDQSVTQTNEVLIYEEA